MSRTVSQTREIVTLTLTTLGLRLLMKSTMLEFRVEWLDAPAVKDLVLARTWARLELQVDGSGSPPRLLTLCVRTSSDSVHRGVYGSVFPVAEWIVENWWFLLFEPLRASEFRSGRTNAAVNHSLSWVQRHNLLAAREGGALPDVTIFRDGPSAVICWAPDPDEGDPTRPTRFISGAGTARMTVSDLQSSLYHLVEAVLERLDSWNDQDSLRLRENWRAIVSSTETEADLCASSAMLGLDPYDPEELTDEVADLLEGEVASQPPLLKNDLLEASSGKTLRRDHEWTRVAASRLEGSHGDTNDQPMLEAAQQLMSAAHHVGYMAARAFRETFDIPDSPIVNLIDLLRRKCGWPSAPEIILDGPSALPQLAMVGKDGDGVPRIVAGQSRHETSRRFRLARGVYFLRSADHPSTRRLITGAHSWDQRASRAFAAELLAPAAVLRADIADEVSDEVIDDLASKFHVSSWVIEHQLANQYVN
jgi:hypothetical protein